MLLEQKVAVVFGAGGAIGSAVARTFAQEGATVFLSGRSLTAVEAVAEAIRSAGGRASAAQVDVLDEDRPWTTSPPRRHSSPPTTPPRSREPSRTSPEE